MTLERWAKVPDFPDYSVSTHGRVRRDTGGRGAKPGRILSPRPSSGPCGNGYLYVCLYGPEGRKEALVHRLVALAFLGAPRGRVVHHRNAVREDNRLANLEWLSQSKNVAESWNRRGAA